VYIYFRDKNDLLFGIGERALQLLRDRFAAAAMRQARGLEQLEAIGREYLACAHELPHYFEVCSRLRAQSMSVKPGTNESPCAVAADRVLWVLVHAIHVGLRDGSIRADVGEPVLLAITFLAFMHGTIQLSIARNKKFARLGVSAPDFANRAFELMLATARSTQ
jgi:AcrR family transcriptional regulator